MIKSLVNNGGLRWLNPPKIVKASRKFYKNYKGPLILGWAWG